MTFLASLYDLVASRRDIRAVAITGMTKNVGKTVTLNYLVRSFAKSGQVLGLLSAGYDGERFDRLTLKEKPRIFVPKGFLIATARACFEAAEARLKLLESSGVSTPLGEVNLGLACRGGLVELAGPGSSSALKTLARRLGTLGANRILVDGAINRLASAAPAVTGGTILATGAAAGLSPADIVRRTMYRCMLLETPQVEDDSLLKTAAAGLARGEAALIHRRGSAWEIEALHAPIPLLLRETLGAKLRQDTAAVVIGGALVDQLAAEIMKRPQLPLLIVRDATKIFLSPEYYSRYKHKGGEIRVMSGINLLAVTLNPVNPAGKGYPPADFLSQMREALSPRPVFDLVYQSEAAP